MAKWLSLVLGMICLGLFPVNLGLYLAAPGHPVGNLVGAAVVLPIGLFAVLTWHYASVVNHG